MVLLLSAFICENMLAAAVTAATALAVAELQLLVDWMFLTRWLMVALAGEEADSVGILPVDEVTLILRLLTFTVVGMLKLPVFYE